VVDSQGLYNSGILGPGQSYTFSFPKAGTYSYVCVIHAPQGMFGKITVEGSQPASLPNTGAGEPAPLLPLLGAAIALALLSLLAHRMARTRAI
jgi:LPXTG-motif cell wall-anchored protein